eukprot:1754297-Amphidinium_carterae.1
MSIPGHPSTFILPEGKAFASVDSVRIGTVNHEKPPELDVTRYLKDIRALKNLPPISTLVVVYVDDLLFCGKRAREVF